MADTFNIIPAKLPSRQRNDTYLKLLQEASKVLKDKAPGSAVRLEYQGHKANTIYQQGMRVRRENPSIADILDLSKRTVNGEQVTFAIRRGAEKE
jgi:hypothetical protein